MRMRPTILPALAILGTLALAGCGGDDMSRTFGLQRDAPDEFRVTTRAPLSMPPSYTLTPPRPGAPRPQEATSRDAAEAVLVPRSAITASETAAAHSPATAHLVQAAGPPAPPDIRAKVEQEASLDRPSQTLVDRMMFWRAPPPSGVAVDPDRESQRLRENAALGAGPDEGTTPIIQPQPRSWIDRLLGL
jgi:hypothetical protein